MIALDPKKIDWDSLGFDALETKSMFKATCKTGESWSGGELVPYGTIQLSPAAGVLNVTQGENYVLVGLKSDGRFCRNVR